MITAWLKNAAEKNCCFIFWATGQFSFIDTIAWARLLKDLSMQVQGISRTFDLYLPEHKSDNPKPLVFMFHGHSGDSNVMTGENQRRAHRTQ